MNHHRDRTARANRVGERSGRRQRPAIVQVHRSSETGWKKGGRRVVGHWNAYLTQVFGRRQPFVAIGQAAQAWSAPSRRRPRAHFSDLDRVGNHSPNDVRGWRVE